MGHTESHFNVTKTLENKESTHFISSSESPSTATMSQIRLKCFPVSLAASCAEVGRISLETADTRA